MKRIFKSPLEPEYEPYCPRIQFIFKRSPYLPFWLQVRSSSFGVKWKYKGNWYGYLFWG